MQSVNAPAELQCGIAQAVDYVSANRHFGKIVQKLYPSTLLRMTCILNRELRC